MRVLVLGAGFGGLELTTSLADQFGEDVEITLVDKTDAFVFGYSKLEVMFGRSDVPSVRHAYADVVRPGVKFVQAEVTSIDAAAKSAETTAGTLEADILVIALGADYDIAATPGLAEHGHEFYTEAGSFALQQTLEEFGGGNVVIGVISAPFKCPPAPSEAALLTHDLLEKRGLRDGSTITLAMPFGRPIPPSPEASAALVEAFAERDITWRPETKVAELREGVAVTGSGDELPFDLFLGVPHHVAPKVVVDSGLTQEGWVPVNPLTLESLHPDVYAIGDLAAVGTPRAGVFAEGQAKVAAQHIAAKIAGNTTDAIYDGHGICYLEFGNNTIAKVDVTFFGDSKKGILLGPDPDFVEDKREFGASRVKRWFGHDWAEARNE